MFRPEFGRGCPHRSLAQRLGEASVYSLCEQCRLELVLNRLTKAAARDQPSRPPHHAARAA